MERWVDGVEKLLPDPGLADPYMQSQAAQGESAVRVERSDEVVLGQALLHASRVGRRKAAEWLLAHGADVNATVFGTDQNTTVLHRMATYSHGATSNPSAIEDERMPIVEWLLAHGADPTLPDAQFPKGMAETDGRLSGPETHLHMACSFNNVGVARVLLDAGADPNEAGDLFHGGTPLGYATLFGFPRLVDLLLEYGGVPYNLNMAAAAGDLALVRGYFLPDGSLRNDACARAILDGVPDEPTFDDAPAVIQKAFQVAVLHSRVVVVRFLLDKGVDVNGGTGVEYHGADWAYLNEPEWAYFVEKGQDVFIWGTALKHAVVRQCEEVAALLRQRGGRL